MLRSFRTSRNRSGQRPASKYLLRCRSQAIGVAIAVVSSLAVPGVALADANQFQAPSWTRLPEPSTYNMTPSCPPTADNNFQCNVPPSSLPPPDPHNIERFLNSAYWPAEKRPDIAVYAVQKYGYDFQNCTAYLPHYCFLVDAQAVGYPIDHAPRVGDLWLAPGRCLAWGPESSVSPECANDHQWYLGYVEQVFPDGSFIQSWGGSTTPEDSGLSLTWFSASMNPYTSFIHLMPPGTPEPGGENTTSVQKPQYKIYSVKRRGRALTVKIKVTTGEGKIKLSASRSKTTAERRSGKKVKLYAKGKRTKTTGNVQTFKLTVPNRGKWKLKASFNASGNWADRVVKKTVKVTK